LPTTKPRLPTEAEILEYIRSCGGSVTNARMYAERFGDVGVGYDTVSRLRRLADEGKLELEIVHHRSANPLPENPSHVLVSMEIRWSLR